MTKNGTQIVGSHRMGIVGIAEKTELHPDEERVKQCFQGELLPQLFLHKSRIQRMIARTQLLVVDAASRTD